VETATPSRIVVVGLGASGLAAARLAVRDGASVIVTDTRPEADLTDRIAELPPGVRTVVAGHPLSVLDGADTVVLSPGVPPTNPLVAEARMRGLTVLPEIEFARRHRESIPLAAVTGSNGKSTVTTLIAAMLEEAGIPAAAGGNLGPPASDIVLDDPEGVRAWVLEVSSFQAEAFVDFRPDVAVFLNLSQDHLERHPDLDSYAAAKGRLFDRQTPKDWAVLNADDPIVAATPTAARKRFFSLEDRADGWVEGDVLMLGDEPLIEATRMKITGRHNRANALAAALAAEAMGAPIDAARRALMTFGGLEHRHRVVHESGGVRWIDDSKATNVGAVVAALGGYPPRSVHLILGGLGKGQDFSVLVPSLQVSVAGVYLIGRDAPIIEEAIGGVVPVRDCKTLHDAVDAARAEARPGQVVLLAPGCASFDQFADYGERGRVFAESARTGEGGSCR